MKVIRKQDEKSNLYIISYETKGPDLVVKTADGSQPRFIDMPENEKDIMEIMWYQYGLNKREYKDIAKKMASNIKKSLAATGIAIGSLTLFFIPGLNFILPIETALLTVGVASLGFSMVKISKIVKAKGKLDDINKCTLLKKDGELLNKIFDPTNSNHLEGVSKATAHKLTSTIKGEVKDDTTYFNINTIGKMSLKDLLKIKANIIRDFYFGFEYNYPSSAKTEESSPKVYKKTLEKKD